MKNKDAITYNLNVTKSEERGRIIVDWEIVGTGWKGEMDMTALVLMAKEAFV
jgi:hypothetical protein